MATQDYEFDVEGSRDCKSNYGCFGKIYRTLRGSEEFEILMEKRDGDRHELACTDLMRRGGASFVLRNPACGFPNVTIHGINSLVIGEEEGRIFAISGVRLKSYSRKR